MFFYKRSPIFVTPKEFSKNDVEFNIYDIQGNYLGTNIAGINKCVQYTEDEKLELEEIIQDYTIKLEINMKFMMEFGVEVENWKKLNKTKDSIVDILVDKWNLSEEMVNIHIVG